MATVGEVYVFMDQIAPFSTQMDFDNAGFLVGRADQEITGLMVCLDITDQVITEAAQRGCQLIVSHHPILFHPAKSITDADPVGRKVLALVEQGIAAICAHTNLDAAVGGVNDALAAAAGITHTSVLEPMGRDGDGNPIGIGRVGVLAEDDQPDLRTYAARIKSALGANGIRCLDAGRLVHHVAVGGGSCGNLLDRVIALGCDTFLTADVKYDVFLDAAERGINLMDAGHFATENIVCPVLAKRLQSAFPTVKVILSGTHREMLFYL